MPDTKGVTITDPQTKKKVPSILATPVAITKANVADPINDQYTPKNTVCTGAYAAKCTKAGVKLARQTRQDRGGRRSSERRPPRTTVPARSPAREGARRPMSDQPILALRGVYKSFGPVDVLKGVDFIAKAGQVTALVGDNGAGKSTLVKCVERHLRDRLRRVPLRGQPGHRALARATPAPSASRSSTRTSRCATTSTSSRTCSSGVSGAAASCSTRAAWSSRAEETLKSLSVRTVKSVRQRVASLSGGQRQTVAIAKAVLWNSKVVMLDEPTAALGVAQTAQVLSLVRRLADRGLAVVLISHNMNDVLQVADSIAVLYLGQMAAQVTAPRSTSNSSSSSSRRAGSEERARPDGASTTRADAGSGVERRGSPHEDLAAVATTVPAANTARDYFRLYVQRVRGGEMGSLPAIAGLIVLVILFSAIQPTFRGLYNFGNMLTEGSGPVLLAMGLVFVLLLGEIDLSAGFAGGVCAAVMVRLMVGYDMPWPITIGAALLTGMVIGLLIGFLRGEGAHPVVRGDAGVLPRLPGRGALHRQQRPGRSTATSASPTPSCWPSRTPRCPSGRAGCWRSSSSSATRSSKLSAAAGPPEAGPARRADPDHSPRRSAR